MAFFLGGIRSRFLSILIAIPSETPDNKMIIATDSTLFQKMFYLALFQDTKDILAIGRVIGVGRAEKRVENVLHFVVTQHLSHGNGSLSGHGKGQSAVDFACAEAIISRKRSGIFSPSRPAGTA